MNIVSLLIIVVGALVGVFVAYRLKTARDLPASKPSFCLLPKYKVSLRLPPEVVSSSEPISLLGQRLAEFGFSESKRESGILRYSRGSLLGDFSIKIAKVNLTFPLPLEAETAVEIAYGQIAAFDTGDLWRFATELKARTEQAA